MIRSQLLTIAPAAFIVYSFVFVNLTSHFRHRRNLDLFSHWTIATRDHRITYKRVLIGIFLICLGSLLIGGDRAAFSVGIYFLIIGYQVLLWSVGVESEYLGTVSGHEDWSSRYSEPSKLSH